MNHYGSNIGNLLEVKEAIKALQGDMERDVKEVVMTMGSHMLQLAEIAKTEEQAKELLAKNIENGKAYEKFIELVENQGGDISYLSNLENLEEAKFIEPVYSKNEGYIYEMDAREIGKLACSLGAGRVRKEDEIDPAVGIALKKKVGEWIGNDEMIAYVHANNPEVLEKAKERLQNIIKIRKEKVKPLSTIIKVIH